MLSILDLPKEISHIHNLFHVSLLRKRHKDVTLVIPLKDTQIDEHLNYIKRLVVVLERKTKTFHNKVTGMEKVQWNHHKAS